MSSSANSIRTLLLHPSLILERLIERRMNASASRFYRQRTQAENDGERAAIFSSFPDIDLYVEEARQLPTYQQIQAASTSDDIGVKKAVSQTTSLDDCVTIYVMMRLFRPQVMVETGVFYGAMSAMILHGMQRNATGKLYSIDLPVDADGLAPELRGGLVNEPLRARWQLILGDSRIELPRLLAQLRQIDGFNHDSLHTTRHMTWEYETAWPYIKPGGFLSSHDVLTTPSWERFCTSHGSNLSMEGRVYGLGIARKRL